MDFVLNNGPELPPTGVGASIRPLAAIANAVFDATVRAGAAPYCRRTG